MCPVQPKLSGHLWDSSQDSQCKREGLKWLLQWVNAKAHKRCAGWAMEWEGSSLKFLLSEERPRKPSCCSPGLWKAAQKSLKERSTRMEISRWDGGSSSKKVLSFFFFFPFIFISCRLITLQYCSGFCHTLTWISHGFTCVPHPEFPSHQEGAFKSYSSLRVSRPKWPKVMVATLLTGLYWGHWIPKHSSLLQKVQNHQIRGPNPNPDHMKDKRRLASDSDCSQGMKDAVEL